MDCICEKTLGTKGRFLPGFHSCDVRLFLQTWPGHTAKGDTRALSLVEKTSFHGRELGRGQEGLCELVSAAGLTPKMLPPRV